MKAIPIFLLGFLICVTTSLYSQNITDIKVDGLLIPRVDRNTVSSPTLGQLIFDTTTNRFWFYDGSQWLLVDNVNDADSDPTNELQTLSKSGTTVSLSNGGGSFTDEVDDSDNDPTNEIQTLASILITSTDAGNNKITNVMDPINDQDVATKAYVDALEAQVEQLQILIGLKVEDIDGNIYDVIEIDSQTWLKQNLRVVHYNDGTPIPNTHYKWPDNDSLANFIPLAHCTEGK